MSFRIESSATFVQVDNALQQKVSRYDALFTASMQKSILRATSHFRNFTGYWEIFHNSVSFEAIVEIFSPRSSEIKDQQLLCRSTTRYSRKFRDRLAFDIWHATNTDYLDFPIFVFNLTLTSISWSHFFNVVTCPFSKTISCSKPDSNILFNNENVAIFVKMILTLVQGQGNEIVITCCISIVKIYLLIQNLKKILSIGKLMLELSLF
jgi:hypothetical protein